MKIDEKKKFRNKRIREYDKKLRELRPEILELTNFHNVAALHGFLGGKNKELLDLESGKYFSEENFISEWLKGLNRYIHESEQPKNYISLNNRLLNNENFRIYTFLFLKKMYLKHYTDYSKNKPSFEKAYYWFGLNNIEYGLFITPRFNNGEWENDKSEIRKVTYKYWSIGHILKTGLVIPNTDRTKIFKNLDELLSFYINELVRSAGSKYQNKIAEYYCEFVKKNDNPEDLLFLFPELRYLGEMKKHQYRLDFAIIDEIRQKKMGFEISPWSSHGQLSKIKTKTQKAVNEEAKNNFSKEMRKVKDYFTKYSITLLTYTDEDLINIKWIFNNQIKPYLQIDNSDNCEIDYKILQDYSYYENINS